MYAEETCPSCLTLVHPQVAGNCPACGSLIVDPTGALRCGAQAGKYIIRKANGEAIDQEALYYVLRFDRSPDDWDALAFYAKLMRKTKPELADAIEADLETVRAAIDKCRAIS